MVVFSELRLRISKTLEAGPCFAQLSSPGPDLERSWAVGLKGRAEPNLLIRSFPGTVPAALCACLLGTLQAREEWRDTSFRSQVAPHNQFGKKKKNQRQSMTAQWIFPGRRLWLVNSIDASHWIASVKPSRAFSSVLSTKTEHLYLNI